MAAEAAIAARKAKELLHDADATSERGSSSEERLSELLRKYARSRTSIQNPRREAKALLPKSRSVPLLGSSGRSEPEWNERRRGLRWILGLQPLEEGEESEQGERGYMEYHDRRPSMDLTSLQRRSSSLQKFPTHSPHGVVIQEGTGDDASILDSETGAEQDQYPPATTCPCGDGSVVDEFGAGSAIKAVPISALVVPLGGDSTQEGGTGGMEGKGEEGGDETTDEVTMKKELEEMDAAVIQDVFERVNKADTQLLNYKYLLSFLLFTALYFTILFFQADASRGHQLSAAHSTLLPPGYSGDSPFSFDSLADVYNWLNNSIIQPLWQDPPCGDGICESPWESPGLSSFGCAADCGNFDKVSNITIHFATHFDSDLEMAAAGWNLCMSLPVSLCWYDAEQSFPSLSSSFFAELQLPDGDWSVWINAPFGGVTGYVLGPQTDSLPATDSSPLDSSGTPSVGSPAPAHEGGPSSPDPILRATQKILVTWGGCAPPGSLESCRQGCSNASLCLATVCTNHSRTALSTAYLDCLRWCIPEPDAALPLLTNSTCPQVLGVIHGFSCSDVALLLEEDPVPSILLDPEPAVSAPWLALGPSTTQRITNLHVAVSRLLYSLPSDECLSRFTPPLTPENIKYSLAFFCTVFGGGRQNSQCSLTNQSSSLSSSSFSFPGILHDRFIRLFLLSLSSVVPVLAPDQLWAFSSVLQALRGTEGHYNKSELCETDGQAIDWGSSAQFNLTINVDEELQWVWSDDLPHSVRLYSLLTSSPTQLLEGFGSGDLLVSRTLACTPDNIGVFDGTFSKPTNPCVLTAQAFGSMQKTTGGFSLTKKFTEPGTFYFDDGRVGSQLSGVLTVLPAAPTPNATATGSSASTIDCAIGCDISFLGNGRCDPACLTPDCVFDGGDCACSSTTSINGGTINGNGGGGTNLDSIDGTFQDCPCPSGQTHGESRACCEDSSLGTRVQFRFSLRSYGNNVSTSDAPFAGTTNEAFSRFVAQKNVVLVGLVLQQTRMKRKQCNPSKFTFLYPLCPGEQSADPFGINPHFLETSSLYNPEAANSIGSFDNSSFGVTLKLNPQGLPFGFIPVSPSVPGFPLVFDVNLDNLAATRRLQYVVDGFFIDNSTETINVLLITYNGDLEIFVVTNVLLTFQRGGQIVAAASIQPLHVEPFGICPLWLGYTLSALYLLGLVVNILGEVGEMLQAQKFTGNALNYLAVPWNWVDTLSLSLQVGGVVVWCVLVHSHLNVYSIQPRYDIYYTLKEFPRYWVTPNPPTGFLEAVDAIKELQYTLQLRTLYFSLQGISVFLVVLRLLKLMDFQPYMGMLTRTISLAAPSLLHFFLLFAIVFLAFSIYGYLVFGAVLDQFESVGQSILSCFLILLNDNGVFYYFMQMSGWYFVAGIIFWWSFIIFNVFILLNFLIAIIVDAFIDVKDSAETSSTLLQDILRIFSGMNKRVTGPYKSYHQMMDELEGMGAEQKHKYKASKFVRKYLRASKILSCFHWSKPAPGQSAYPSSTSTAAKNEPFTRAIRVQNADIDATNLATVLERTLSRAPLLHLQRATSSKKLRPVDSQELADALVSHFGEIIYHNKILEARLQQEPRKNVEVHRLKAAFEEFREQVVEILEEIRNGIFEDDKIKGPKTAKPNSRAHSPSPQGRAGSASNAQPTIERVKSL